MSCVEIDWGALRNDYDNSCADAELLHVDAGLLAMVRSDRYRVQGYCRKAKQKRRAWPAWGLPEEA
eukprot:3328001-Pyramimonas_sp.AAC.1